MQLQCTRQMVLGRVLRKIRVRKGLDQKTIAKNIGSSVANVSKLELGSRKITVDHIIKFCEVCQEDPSKVFNYYLKMVEKIKAKGVSFDRAEGIVLTPNQVDLFIPD